MVEAAVARGAEQELVRKALRGVALDGVWPDGTTVKRGGTRLAALKMMHSEVPEKVLEKMVGVGETAERKTLTVHLVLDAKVDQLEGRSVPKLIEQVSEEEER
jgi:hypothetical protein